MSIGKQVSLLLTFLVIFIGYSVYSFDYKTNSLKDMKVKNELIIKEDTSSIMDKFNEFKDQVFTHFNINNDENISSISTSFDLLKVDGNIVLNGIFKDKEEVKKVMETLNINKEGNITYNENCILDENILSKLVSLSTPLKDFFYDASKLSFISGNISLIGELKDSNYKNLLDSIISRTELDIHTNVFEPNVSKRQEIMKTVNKNTIIKDDIIEKENMPNEKSIEKVILKKEDEIKEEKIDKKLDKIDEKSTNYNLSQKSKQIQSSINKILSDKKITFERRSTKITEDSFSVVKEISKVLIDNPHIKIEIAGHTDSRGSNSLNKRISQNRANSVMASLIQLGVQKDRLTAVGYGEKFPIAKDDKDGLSEINRRVEFNIIGE